MVLGMLFIGVGMVSTAVPLYPVLRALHRPLGVLILALALMRLPLRLATGAPALPTDLPRLQRLAAKASHVLFYASMGSLPLIGWGVLSSSGYPVQLTKALILLPIRRDGMLRSMAVGHRATRP